MMAKIEMIKSKKLAKKLIKGVKIITKMKKVKQNSTIYHLIKS